MGEVWGNCESSNKLINKVGGRPRAVDPVTLVITPNCFSTTYLAFASQVKILIVIPFSDGAESLAEL
jgi:hypothetical protein